MYLQICLCRKVCACMDYGGDIPQAKNKTIEKDKYMLVHTYICICVHWFSFPRSNPVVGPQLSLMAGLFPLSDYTIYSILDMEEILLPHFCLFLSPSKCQYYVTFAAVSPLYIQYSVLHDLLWWFRPKQISGNFFLFNFFAQDAIDWLGAGLNSAEMVK